MLLLQARMICLRDRRYAAAMICASQMPRFYALRHAILSRYAIAAICAIRRDARADVMIARYEVARGDCAATDASLCRCHVASPPAYARLSPCRCCVERRAMR